MAYLAAARDITPHAPETRAGHSGVPSRFTAIARFLIPWRPGDRWEVLRLSDPRPFFSESVSWFRSLRS